LEKRRERLETRSQKLEMEKEKKNEDAGLNPAATKEKSRGERQTGKAKKIRDGGIRQQPGTLYRPLCAP